MTIRKIISLCLVISMALSLAAPALAAEVGNTPLAEAAEDNPTAETEDIEPDAGDDAQPPHEEENDEATMQPEDNGPTETVPEEAEENEPQTSETTDSLDSEKTPSETEVAPPVEAVATPAEDDTVVLGLSLGMREMFHDMLDSMAYLDVQTFIHFFDGLTQEEIQCFFDCVSGASQEEMQTIAQDLLEMFAELEPDAITEQMRALIASRSEIALYTNYNAGSNDITLSSGGTHTVYSSAGSTEKAYSITVRGGGTFHITLNGTLGSNMVLKSSGRPVFHITGNSTVYLTVVGYTKLESTGAFAGVQVDSGSKLIITDASTGSLQAYGGTDQYYSGAGIGGASKASNGQITINGGTISAYGGNKPYYGAAGIGSGAGAATSSNITINGGHVTAYGSKCAHYGAAGIGGGSGSSASNITIAQQNNSILTNVHAYPSTEAASNGAAIGGGYDGAASNITITGGTIYAHNETGASGYGGAGIGSGGSPERNHSVANKIYISGGNITAHGNEPGAGIGGGTNNDGVDIRITGSAVVEARGGAATGDHEGAGIGGGYHADGKDITISTTGSVNADGNSYAAGIGGGAYGNGVNITLQGTSGTHTTVQARSGSCGAAIGGGEYGAGINLLIDCADVSINAYNGAGIGSGYYYRPLSGQGTRYDGDIKNTTDIPNGATVSANIKITNSTITTTSGSSFYEGSLIGTGTSNSGTSDTSLYAVIDISNSSIAHNNYLYRSALVGVGASASYNTAFVKVRNCEITMNNQSSGSYGTGIGCGSNCNNSTIDVSVDNCDNLSSTIYSGTGIGIGPDSYNLTANFSIRNCDNMNLVAKNAYTTMSNGYPYQTGAGIGTAWNVYNSQLTFHVENCTGISASTDSGTAIGLGEGNYGNTAQFEFENCGDIEASSIYGVGIGLGTASHNNTAGFTFTGCGNIIAQTKNSGTGGSEEQQYSGAAIGIGSHAYGNKITINVEDCGNLTANASTVYAAAIGTAANSYNNSFHATITGDKSHTISLRAGTNGVGVGAGFRNYVTNNTSNIDISIKGYDGITVSGMGTAFGVADKSFTANHTFETAIKLEDCGDIDIQGGEVGFGIGNEVYGAPKGHVNTKIDVLNCGNITMNATTGIGVHSYASGNVKTDINVTNCGNIEVTANNTAIGTGTGIGIRRVENDVATTIHINNCGDVTVSGGTTGIGLGSSNRSGGNTAIKIENCAAITAKAEGSKGIAIGASYNDSTVESPAPLLDIDIIGCSSVTAIASANNIGIGAYRDGNNVQADILIQNSGAVTALVGSETMSTGNGVGIGVGHTSFTSNDASTPVTIRIVGCDSVDARGSRYGAAIGAGRNVSTATAQISITGTKTVTAVAGKDAPGIGIGYGGGTNLAVTITIKDASITAASKGADGYGAAAIGTAYGCRGGHLTLDFSGCNINAHSENGPSLGLGRKNESKQTVSASLTNCTGEYAATGYSAGIGQGLENANSVMELFIHGGSVTATGSKGGAGIGTGPVNTGCSFILEVDGNAVINATGSASLDNELAVLGSTGNQVLDQLAQNRVMGAGAGIGGSDGTQILSITITDGSVTATGANADIYASSGIGGGSSGGGGVISIYGGTVKAYGSERGAAIGGGSRGIGGTVQILGGNVTATGGLLSPAIGGGAGAADNGTLLLGDGRLAKYDKATTYPVLTAYGYMVNQPAVKADITTDNVKLLQATMLEPISTERPIRVRAQGYSDTHTLTLPANYDAFATTLSADLADTVSYQVYTDAMKNGVSTEYQLATSLDAIENFPVLKSSPYFAERLTLIIFYDVTFDTNGGSVAAKQQVRGGHTAVMPTNPKKTGSVFAGWYTDESCVNPFDFSEPVNQDTVLYAKWEATQKLPYTVQHWKQTLDGEYALSNIEYLFGDDGQQITASAKDFEGFHIIVCDDEVKNGVLEMGASAPVLKLYYDRDMVTVEFRNIEITDTTKTSITEMWGTQIILTEPTKTNWEFTQWTKGDKNGEVVQTFTPVRIETLGNVLYANFSLRNGAQYLVRDYLRNIDGSYTMVREEEYADIIGTEITAPAREYEGFRLNESISSETSHGIVQKDGSTVLKLYYDRITVNVKLLNGFMDTTEVTRPYGEKASIPTPSRDGYRFDGWFTKSGQKVDDDMLIQELGEAVSAKWTAAETTRYSIRYYLQEPSGEYTVCEVNDLAGETGSTVKAQVKPFKGYTFNADKSIVAGTVAGNGTLLLSVYYDINSMSVTYVSNCDMEIPKQEGLYYGQLVTAPKTPVRDGYTFEGWYIDPDLSIEWIFRADTLQADTTLYAKWERISITVELKDAYMDINEITRYHGEAANLPTPARTGYRFDGWFMASGSKVPDDALIQNIGSSVTAKWTSVDTTKYSVRYYREKEDGTYAVYEVVDLLGETDATVTAQIKQYPGYTYNADKSTISGNVDAAGTLILTVYYDVNTFRVTFDPMGGSTVATLESVCYGSRITEPETPTRDGYVFSGWFLDKTHTDEWKFRSDSVKKNITLYAKWTPVEDTGYIVEHYTAEKNGSYTVAYTDRLTAKTDSEVTASPKTFPGFVEDVEDGRRVSSGTVKGDGSLVLKLYYKRATVTVTFKTGMKNPDTITQTVFWGDKLTEPSNPTKSGFKGWLGPDGQMFDFDTPVTEDMTLTAKYASIGGGTVSVQEYTVSFVTNCDMTVPTQRVAAGKHAVRPVNVEKIGCELIGWYYDKSFSKVFDFEKNAVNDDMVLYAKWEFAAPSLLNTKDHIAYIAGRDNGLFDANAAITRGEVATILYRLLTDEVRKEYETDFNVFTDIDTHWARTAIATLANLDVVHGYENGTFRPDSPIARAEYATMLINLYRAKTMNLEDKFSDIKDHWAREVINTAAELGLAAGYEDGTFQPSKNISRAEAVTMMNRILRRSCDEKTVLEEYFAFNDIQPNDWFYWSVVEASNNHGHELKTGVEYWTELQ